MKVAITFFGFMRNFRNNAPYWRRLIDKYNADVFIHTWDTEEYKNPDSVGAGHSGQLDTSELLSMSEVHELYNPKLFIADTYSNHHNIFVEKTRWMEEYREQHLKQHPEQYWVAYDRYAAMVSMHYKWWKVSQLKQQYEINNNFLYDVVLHSRTDFRPDESFTIEDTKNIVTGPWPSTPHTQHWVDYTKGINDFWVYGPSKLMDIMCSIYPRLDKIWEFCMSTEGYGFKEAVNIHTVPVTNFLLSLPNEIVKLNSQHGEKI